MERRRRGRSVNKERESGVLKMRRCKGRRERRGRERKEVRKRKGGEKKETRHGDGVINNRETEKGQTPTKV